MSRKTRTTQICGTSDIDFISNLPDGVIGHILSCLPIKDVMRTSVLSKDWKFKWSFVYNVQFRRPHIKMHVLDLVGIVEKMLISLGSLRSFSLQSFIRGDDEVSRMVTLLHALLRRDIEILELFVAGCKDNVIPVLPLSILNRTSLRNFEFTMHCILKVPAENSFPNLRRISLNGVKIVNENSDKDTIIFNFPVLKAFDVSDCDWLEVNCVEIHAPALVKFNISTSSYKSKEQSNEPHNYSIKILGSRLSAFGVYGGYIEKIVLIDSTVADAVLHCRHDSSNLSLEYRGLQVRKLLKQLSNIRSLVLSEIIPAIWATKLGRPLPRFGKLEKLQVYPPFAFEGLLDFLRATPFLRMLELYVVPKHNFNFDAVESTPSCVLNHLEEIMFGYINMEFWHHHDFGVEKFLLKNALRLKAVLVDVSNSSQQNYIVEKLLTFPIGSTCLRISLKDR